MNILLIYIRASKIIVAELSGTRETLTPLVRSILETFNLNADQCYHLLVGPEPGIPTYQLRGTQVCSFIFLAVVMLCNDCLNLFFMSVIILLF